MYGEVFAGDSHSILTPSGYRIIHSYDDLVYTIREFAGDEIADITDDVIEDLKSEYIYEEMRARTDADVIEGENEELRNVMQDAADSIEQILNRMDETESRTIGKKAFALLYKRLADIQKDLRAML